jgi:hypothetical protein
MTNKERAPWRIEGSSMNSRTSKARKLRRKFHRKEKGLTGPVRPEPITIFGRYMGSESVYRRDSVLRRLTVPNKTPNITRIGKSISILSNGLDPAKWDYESLPVLLQELELSYLEKMGPRTIYDPVRMEKTIRELTSPKMGNFRGNDLRVAIENVHRKLANLPKIPLPVGPAYAALLVRQKETSAGFPWYMHRDAVMYQYMPDDWRRQNPERDTKAGFEFTELRGMLDPVQSVERIRQGEEISPPVYTANFRTESGGSTPKLRLVWAAPLDNQILEAMWAVPVQQVLKYDNYEADKYFGSMFMYSSEYLQMNLLRDMFSYAEDNNLQVISADYSAFDTTISESLIREAFRILIGESKEATLVANRFIVKKLLSPWGINEVRGMVPSGSVFTNLIDSVVNAIILEYIAIRTSQDVAYRVNGDDSVAVFSESISDPELEIYSSELGIDMNPSKQARSKNSCQFNKSYWGFEYEGSVPSANRVINSLVNRDSMLEGWGMSANEECVRSIQVLDRLAYHPWRDQVLETIYRFSFLDDGHSALDYRWRLPRSTLREVVEDGEHIDMSSYVAKLDQTFWAKIYE